MDGQVNIFELIQNEDNKPPIGSEIWSCSGCKIEKHIVTSHNLPHSPEHYFQTKCGDDTYYLSAKSVHKWWDYSKEAAKKCFFANGC